MSLLKFIPFSKHYYRNLRINLRDKNVCDEEDIIIYIDDDSI